MQDQIFTVKQKIEEKLSDNSKVCLHFIDLEKAFDEG